MKKGMNARAASRQLGGNALLRAFAKGSQAR